MTMFEYMLKSYREMKEKPPKERWDYFFEYYKWPALAVILVIVIIVSSIITIANRKEDVLYATLLNCATNIEEVTYVDDFYPFAGIDAKKEAVLLSNDLSLADDASGSFVSSFEMLLATIGAKRVDVLIAPDAPFQTCAYNGSRMLADLRDLVDAETLEQWKDHLYYIDGDVLEAVRNATTATEMPELPDPFDPEAMSDPIPVAVDISGCTGFRKAYYPIDEVLYLGIVATAPHPEMSVQFIDFLFAE